MIWWWCWWGEEVNVSSKKRQKCRLRNSFYICICIYTYTYIYIYICIRTYIYLYLSQAEDPGKSQCCGSSLKVICWRISSFSGEDQRFGSIQAFTWLDEAHPPRVRAICFTQSPQNWMLISSPNTLRNIQKSVWPNIWASWPSQADV